MRIAKPAVIADAARAGGPLKNVFQRMVVAQFVELDIFLEAFQRGVAGELLEAGDVDPLRDPGRDRPAPEAVAGKLAGIEPGRGGPFLDGADAKARWGGRALRPAGDARRRQPPDAAKQWTDADRRGGKPGVE
jgi:hypothetical protein